MLTVWLSFFILCTTVAATTNPPWQNPEYETMQNITNVIGEGYTTYFVYEGTFVQDVLIGKHVFCLIMRTTGLFGEEVVAYRKYQEQVGQTQEEMNLYLTPKRDSGYDVDNYMKVVEDEYQEEVAQMHLVYTDYSTCALFYYDGKDEYELWLYQKPNGVASSCELLLALLSDKTRNVHYTNDCS
uniref:Putative salivary lipocalin n=1 Tax=Ixodes ricinus TaxID=34613 RepID=A0A0K8R8P3_IXORI